MRPNLAEFGYEDYDHERHHLVLGVVVAKGSVIEHGTEGFRAEHARPIALASDVHHQDARLAAQAYEVPLIPLGELHAFALKFGRQINAEDTSA